MLLQLGTFFLLVEMRLSAIALPKMPSASNYIQRNYRSADTKSYSEKTLLQNTNVEKPDTEDYRLLEIQVDNAANVASLDLHGLVKAVLNEEHDRSQLPVNSTSYPHPEVVPNSIFGVRDVGYGPNYRGSDHVGKRRLPGLPKVKSPNQEKLYYLKNVRPRVFVNFRGHSGTYGKDVEDLDDPKLVYKYAASNVDRATRPYDERDESQSPVGQLVRNEETSTTENSMVTSSELPKQIPAPPSKIPTRSLISHTTPVQRYAARRTDILPGYAFAQIV